MSNWKVGPGGRLYHPTTGAYVGQLDDNGNEQMVVSAFPSGSVPESSDGELVFPMIGGKIAPKNVAPVVLVYGGTPAGITAAIAAAREGARAILVNQPNPSALRRGLVSKIGGMIVGGLMATDHRGASFRQLNQLTGEVYARAARRYGQSLQTAVFQDLCSFPPHVMEAVFWEMLNEAGVQVMLDYRLPWGAGVTKSTSEIISITLENPTTKDVKTIFVQQAIDASYEGDLAAWAGVTMFVGRESSATYGESNAGVLASTKTSITNVSPYVIAGDAGSGLLPGIENAAAGTDGAADGNVLSYNFRLTVTNDASNRIPFPQPLNYRPELVELLPRRAGITPTAYDTIGELFTPYNGRDGKKDWNNSGGWMGTNYNGQGARYVNAASYDERYAVWREHEDYVQSYLWVIQQDPRLALGKAAIADWGFCRDEHVEYGGMSSHLYIREARRMTSARYVHTQADIEGTRRCPDPIAICTYPGDLHDCRRGWDGTGIYLEGHANTVVPNIWRVDRGAILPQPNQCSNLQVVCCAGVSHAAYGSYRMEAYYMSVGEAAGVAAAMAISARTRVGEVGGADIRPKVGRMEPEDEAVMNMNTGTAGTTSIAGGSLTVTGTWIAIVNLAIIPGNVGNDVWHDNGTSKGGKSVRFTPSSARVPTAGNYRIRINLPTSSIYQKNAVVRIKHGRSATPTDIIVDNAETDTYWLSLGTYWLAADGSDYVEIRNDNGAPGIQLAVDAVSFERVGP